MKTEVWCKSDYSRGIKRGVRAWVGELSVVPPKDSYVVVHDGWGAARVVDSFLNLYDGTLIIEIPADYSGEYTQKSVELGLIENDPNAQQASNKGE